MTDQAQTEFLINGIERDSIPANDRGLLYGDGLFETIAFVDGAAPLWDLHLKRLSISCQRLFLPVPEADVLAAECQRLAQCRARAVVRVTITRGCGGQAYIPPEHPQTNRILMRREFPSVTGSVDMIRSSIPLAQSDALSGIKHLNRLEQVLIGHECRQHNVSEALVCDAHGFIVEGLSSNLLIEQNDQLIAPGPHPGAVAGVGLSWLRSQVGNELHERPFHIDELTPNDSLWVINSVVGIRSVATLDGQPRARGSMLEEQIQAWNKLYKVD